MQIYGSRYCDLKCLRKELGIYRITEQNVVLRQFTVLPKAKGQSQHTEQQRENARCQRKEM